MKIHDNRFNEIRTKKPKKSTIEKIMITIGAIIVHAPIVIALAFFGNIVFFNADEIGSFFEFFISALAGIGLVGFVIILLICVVKFMEWSEQ